MLKVENLWVGKSPKGQLLSFCAGDGSLIGIYGPPGSGKTSALNRIAEGGECSADVCCRVELDGKDRDGFGFKFRKANHKQWQRYFNSTAAYLQQKPERNIDIFNSMGEQIKDFISLLLDDESNEQAILALQDEYLSAVGLHPKALKRSLPELSLGEKRLCAMTLALARQPKLILAEMPESGLSDIELAYWEKHLFPYLRDHNITFVVASNRLEWLASFCDAIYDLPRSCAIPPENWPAPSACRTPLPFRPAGTFMSPEQQPLLEVRDLYLSDAANQPLLQQISFSLYEGEVLGIWGLTGSGKTLLSRVLIGLKAPEAGFVQMRDEAGEKPFFQRISIAFQDCDTALNPQMTVRNIVLEPLRLTTFDPDRHEKQRRAEEILERFHIDRSDWDSPALMLNRGDRQLVSLARALVVLPRLIVVDDIFGVMGQEQRAIALAVLREYRKTHGVTQLLLSGELRLLFDSCDRVCILHQGYMIAQFTGADQPQHPFVRLLRQFSEAGVLSPGLENWILSPLQPFSDQCPFYSVCAMASDACRKSEYASGHCRLESPV